MCMRKFLCRFIIIQYDNFWKMSFYFYRKYNIFWKTSFYFYRKYNNFFQYSDDGNLTISTLKYSPSIRREGFFLLQDFISMFSIFYFILSLAFTCLILLTLRCRENEKSLRCRSENPILAGSLIENVITLQVSCEYNLSVLKTSEKNIFQTNSNLDHTASNKYNFTQPGKLSKFG